MEQSHSPELPILESRFRAAIDDCVRLCSAQQCMWNYEYTDDLQTHFRSTAFFGMPSKDNGDTYSFILFEDKFNVDRYDDAEHNGLFIDEKDGSLQVREYLRFGITATYDPTPIRDNVPASVRDLERAVKVIGYASARIGSLESIDHVGSKFERVHGFIGKILGS